jgi:hypothetical protein
MATVPRSVAQRFVELNPVASMKEYFQLDVIKGWVHEMTTSVLPGGGRDIRSLANPERYFELDTNEKTQSLRLLCRQQK